MTQLVLGNIVPLSSGSKPNRDVLEYFRQYSKGYQKNIRRHGGKRGMDNLMLGCAAEFLVIAWLLSRKIEVATLCNKQSHHDLVAFMEGRWWTIQVKLGAVNTKTDNIRHSSPRSRIWSDIVATVDLETNRVKWLPMRETLPTQLALADLRPQT